LSDGVIRDQSGDPGQSAFAPGPNLDSFLSHFPEAIKRYGDNLQGVTKMFSLLDPSQMELISTIHYMHSSHRQWFKQTPSKDSVVASVLQVKGDKFTRRVVERAYDILAEAKLLT